MEMSGPDRGSLPELAGVDLYDASLFAQESMHPVWARMRLDAPIQKLTAPGGTPYWNLTRYADVRSVVGNARSFGSEHGTILAVTEGDVAGGRTINLTDPPAHRHLRVPTMRLMSTRIMQAGRSAIRENVRRLIEPFFRDDVVDAADILLELPMTSIGQVLGLPRETWRAVSLAAMRGVAPEDPSYATGTVAVTLRDAHADLFGIFDDVVEARRQAPANDLVSTLLALDFGGRKLNSEEVILNCFSFAMGATTTTPHTAIQFVRVMAEQPEIWHQVRSAPATIDAAVEEALRWSTPTNHLLRRATRTMTFYGQKVRQGELVCAWVASANRDERVFDRPYEFRLDRRPNRHIAFGSGPHYCIGAPAVRAVMRILFQELAGIVKRFELAGKPAHVHSNFINGLTSLPIRVIR